jgi:hypothetical protein
MKNTQRQNIRFFRLLNDDTFWQRYCAYSFSYDRIKRLREYRTKLAIPRPTIFKNFIEEYKQLENDPRSIEEIALYLMQEVTPEEV